MPVIVKKIGKGQEWQKKIKNIHLNSAFINISSSSSPNK